MKQVQNGYSLVELLISVLVFSVVLGVLFSAFLYVRQIESARRVSAQLTQSTENVFSRLTRAIGTANAAEKIIVVRDNGSSCEQVYGYYLSDEMGNITQGKNVALGLNQKIVVIEKVPRSAADDDQTYEWVKREYQLKLKKNKDEESYRVLNERTYHVFSSSVYQWPQQLSSCEATENPWVGGETEDVQLTPDFMNIRSIEVSFLSRTQTLDTQPFFKLSLSVADMSSKHSEPLVLQTTISPVGESND